MEVKTPFDLWLVERTKMQKKFQMESVDELPSLE
jgi:hypothetical protein